MFIESFFGRAMITCLDNYILVRDNEHVAPPESEVGFLLFGAGAGGTQTFRTC